MVFPKGELPEVAPPRPAAGLAALPKGAVAVPNALVAGLEKGDAGALAVPGVLPNEEGIAGFEPKGEVGAGDVPVFPRGDVGVDNAERAGFEKGLPSAPEVAVCGDVAPAGLSVGVAKREENVLSPVLLPKGDDGVVPERPVSRDVVGLVESPCFGGKSELLEEELMTPTPARPEWWQRLRLRHAEFPDLHDPSFPAGR